MNRTNDICILIPTYRNAGTVMDVVRRSLEHGLPVIVVDDGSPDGTSALLENSGLPVTVLQHTVNKGKGKALQTGLGYACSQGFRYAISLDSDGQHLPEDIPLFLEAMEREPGALIVGSRDLRAENMPVANSFANSFSNFWFRVQTLRRLPDTQTGFRAYPLERLPSLKLLTARYEAELSMLVFSAWKGIKILSVPVRVFYPCAEERISSFRPFRDFFRISLLNTGLCLAALVYGYPRMLINKLIR